VPALEKLIIDTPEQVSLEYPLAGAGSRFLALGIDVVVQLIAFAGLGILGVLAAQIVAVASRRSAVWIAAILVALAFVVHYGYFATFEAVWNGQTPGKRAVGIRVVAVSGRPLTAFDAIVRNVLRIVDQIPGMYAVGLLALFVTPRNQRLGDVAAGTVVVHDHASERPLILNPRFASLPTVPPGSRHYGARRLSAAEVMVAEAFLERRTTLDSEVRLAMARRVFARMERRLALAPGSAIDEERMLEEMVREYRGR
jgi:uncharacterized RDD family membrane protein YckC